MLVEFTLSASMSYAAMSRALLFFAPVLDNRQEIKTIFLARMFDVRYS